MKIRTFVTALLFSAGGMTLMAQETPESCNVNSSISHEAAKAGNFKDAYEPWKAVMKDCPTLRYYTYTDGFDILKFFLSQNDKGTPEYKAFFDELMATHDQLMQYTPELQKKARGIRSVARSKGMKALDYIQFAPQPDMNLAYGWLKEAVEEDKAETPASMLFYFLQTSQEILKANPAHSEAFIMDYLSASQYADDAIAAADKESTKKSYSTVKENLVALFINSGAADCESLQAIYGPKVEEFKTNLDELKKVIDIMRMMKCTESEAYFQAAFYSYQIEPTADAAAGVAAMSYKKGDIDATIKFIDEAIELETDNIKKADFAYRAAAVLTNDKKLSQARNYAQKSISFNPNSGQPYILIANLYATSPNWSDESALNKCTYFLIIDKLNRAKAVDSDPEIIEEANRQIRTYSQYTPSPSDLFMLGYKVGDRVTIGGWIGESTTIR